ncbi:Fic family protein [Yoonia maritima]|uniref:Fic family protein n=1 Tax=Yoonia maritima TaxID=1435347 RepID=A0A2T0VTR3_9RHOB|nr:Fic family protein [Yoonia maritima]PRY74653.1 Fic family protein [Yoonia maritima]
MFYIHEHSDWPTFTWDKAALAAQLAAVRYRQGRLLGRMEDLGFDLRNEAMLRTLTSDVVKSSEIEGEMLDNDQVRSSIAKRLGIDISGLIPADRNVDGVVEMMLDATQGYDQRLDAERLFGWHAALFPNGRSGMQKITVGAWRPAEVGPMQVVSGAIGRERVHFEAPHADRLDGEMAIFLDWFAAPPETDPVIIAAIAHFWFVTIHPLEDGNGRIARAIADMALARSEASPQRFYSMSTQIRHERKAYYDMLEKTQKGGLDITPWLHWFLQCLDRAFDGADEILTTVFAKARFWEKHAKASLNVRQQEILNRLLDGFDGKLTSSKYAKIAKCSQDTAGRDIRELIEIGALQKDEAGGRSTSYSLVAG